MTKQFRDFKSAREFLRALNLKNTEEWKAYCKSGNKPNNIPVNPNRYYKNDFKGMGDFLGTGTLRTQDREYRPFNEAREFVRKLNLKGYNEWLEYCKSGNKPDDIPSGPVVVYKKDFKGTEDWLGSWKLQWRNFKEAREFVRALNLKGTKEWKEYCKSGNKPNDIPFVPDYTYKNKGWVSYGDWLGNEFRPYKEAREFTRSLGLKNSQEWREYCKSGNKPNNIPVNPNRYYKNEWKGYGDWLDNEKVFRPYKEAREFVRKLKLKNQKEWREYYKSGNKPNDIPSDPLAIYKKDFKGIGDWLGTGNIAPKDREYRPFKEAREFVRSLKLKNWKEWLEYCKSGDKPDDIPADPPAVYREWKKK